MYFCGNNKQYQIKQRSVLHLEVAQFQFLKIVIPVPWDILEELEPEFEAKESKGNRFRIHNSSFQKQAEGIAIHDS